jgi:hypothetical protein
MLFLFFIFSYSALVAQDLDPGFYLTQTKTPDCKRTIKLSARKKDFLCLTERPIISTDQFIGLSGIETNTILGINYTDLTITEDATKVLKALSATLRSSTMVLILDNRLMGILNYNDDPFVRQNQIRISVKFHEGSMAEVHSHLKAIVERNARRAP